MEGTTTFTTSSSRSRGPDSDVCRLRPAYPSRLRRLSRSVKCRAARLHLWTGDADPGNCKRPGSAALPSDWPRACRPKKTSGRAEPGLIALGGQPGRLSRSRTVSGSQAIGRRESPANGGPPVTVSTASQIIIVSTMICGNPPLQLKDDPSWAAPGRQGTGTPTRALPPPPDALPAPGGSRLYVSQAAALILLQALLCDMSVAAWGAGERPQRRWRRHRFRSWRMREVYCSGGEDEAGALPSRWASKEKHEEVGQGEQGEPECSDAQHEEAATRDAHDQNGGEGEDGDFASIQKVDQLGKRRPIVDIVASIIFDSHHSAAVPPSAISWAELKS
jgi:hypothetical protein